MGVGILIGAVAGFLALWLPLFVPFSDDDGRFWLAVGVSLFTLIGAVTMALDQAKSRRTYVGGAIGVVLGILLGFYALFTVISGLGS